MGANFWVSMEENFEQTTQTEMFEDTSAYKVRLDNFEGPLDLLLHLIKEAKLDIATVKLSAITEQYLEYMEQIPELDMEKASEFIEVAATLIEIKSKKLLPKPEEILPEEEDPEAKLLRQLQEYKIFKEASEELGIPIHKTLCEYSDYNDFITLKERIVKKHTVDIGIPIR